MSFIFYSPQANRTLHAHGIKTWVTARSAQELKEKAQGRFLVGAIAFDTNNPTVLFEPEEWYYTPGPPTLDQGTEHPKAQEDEDFGQQHWDSFEQRVTQAVETIHKDNALHKVVLARLAAWTPQEGNFHAPHVYAKLQYANPHAYSFYLNPIPEEYAIGDNTSLVGASPELVLEAHSSTENTTHYLSFSTFPLAGSLPAAQAEKMSEEEIHAALYTEKNKEEHAFVIKDIAAVLEKFTKDYSVPQSPSIVRTPRVLHLGTPIQGRIPTDNTSLAMIDFLYALHPTPAVSGFPQEKARDYLANHSVFNRGLFSGIVGWMDAREEENQSCEWAMTLRCGLVSSDRAVAFAGAGIVADSDPYEELLETRAKLSTFAHALDA